MNYSELVFFRLNRADANTAAREIVAYDQKGNTITLAAGESLWLKYLAQKAGATAVTITSFVDHDGNSAVTAGEEVMVGEYGAKAGESVEYAGDGRFLGTGSNKLKAYTSANAQIYVTGWGYLKRA